MLPEVDRHLDQVREAAAFLRRHLPFQPDILIQSGTGLSDLADALTDPWQLAYEDIPHFPVSTVTSHQGNLVVGRLAGRPVALLQGRVHYYEGYSARRVAFPVRVLAELGLRYVLITNASGGLNPAFVPGTIMILTDHIYLLPDNPLRGPNIDQWGPRFPDLSRPYDRQLRELALETARQEGLDEIRTGTYVCIPGPSLETPAETRYLRMIGADAVGMSSLPEILVAIHAGLRVLGLSVVANVNDPDDLAPILLDDIVAAARRAEPRLQRLIRGILGRWPSLENQESS